MWTAPMHRFILGHVRFQQQVVQQQRDFFNTLGSGQSPEALFITCADSRVDPCLITQSQPGDIFVCRNVGNIVPPFGEFTGGVSSAIEYGVMALGVQHIVVMGHTDCGAMKALLRPEAVRSMPTVATWLRHAETARFVVDSNHDGATDQERLALVTRENVLAQLDHLRTHPSVAARIRRSLRLHGWIYDVSTGRIDAWDPSSARFAPLEELGLTLTEAA
jgi:carbonic anhydrase